MKQLFFLFYLLTFLSAKSQYDTIFESGKMKLVKHGVSYNNEDTPFKKDDYYFELSIGYPFFPWYESNSFGSQLLNNSQAVKVKSNTHHVCANAEYQLNSEISVGIELTYATAEFTYNRHFTTYNTTVYPYNIQSDTTYSARVSKLRLLAKMGYHFNISQKFDAYCSGGFGLKNQTFSGNDWRLNTNDEISRMVPVALRAAIGGRFFFGKNMALHVEGGIGGPMLQIGLTWRKH